MNPAAHDHVAARPVMAGRPAVRVVVFDLGDTLLEYEGLPLSWEQHYPAALRSLADHVGLAADSRLVDLGSEVLRRYNTRLSPRLSEAPFARIAAEIAAGWGHDAPIDEPGAAHAFFRVFRQRLRPFPESLATLTRLHADGYRIAAFTDVPYGMPSALVQADLAETGLRPWLDLVVTSGDVGWRKPSPRTLQHVAGALTVEPTAMSYVGNERKDVEAALAFGCEAVLIVRAGAVPDWGQHRTLRTLSDL